MSTRREFLQNMGVLVVGFARHRRSLPRRSRARPRDMSYRTIQSST